MILSDERPLVCFYSECILNKGFNFIGSTSKSSLLGCFKHNKTNHLK